MADITAIILVKEKPSSTKQLLMLPSMVYKPKVSLGTRDQYYNANFAVIQLP